jgi:serine/threonine protein kinase
MAPATRFGPYEIIRRLGKSMNDVYLAQDTRANRPAALKLIRSGPDAASRLVLEAERRGAAIQQSLRLLDPRVIEVYEYGDLEGYFFVAMQYVEGRNLSEVLARDGRMSADRAARIALEICGQLEKFHSFRPGDGATAPVVHGDIKPSNIHLGLNETVRLLDFGIAKTLRPDRDFTYHNFGSPGYCSPERLGRSLLDQQADLWAVGATLYEMLAGAPPYQAENTRKLERLIQSRRPPRALHATCPRALKAVVGKALAPDAARRYRSASAFSADLKAFLEGGETVAEQEKRKSWRPNPTLESAQAAEPEAARTPLSRWLRTVSRVRQWRGAWRVTGRIAAAVGCVLTGMILFIGTSFIARYFTVSHQLGEHLDYARRTPAEINADWQRFQDLQNQFAFLGRHTPVNALDEPLRSAYKHAADQIIEGYDRSTDPLVRHFDWPKAELCLTRAMELGAKGNDTAAKLAMVRGYTTLVRIMDWRGGDPSELAVLRATVRDHFADAGRDAPQWPDPHLGLARVFLYSLPDYDRALDELAAAERLGYRLGAREIEQRADGYRLRGFEKTQKGELEAARLDFEMARSLYRTIPGFSLADKHLAQIPDLQVPPPARAPGQHPLRPRRWR